MYIIPLVYTLLFILFVTLIPPFYSRARETSLTIGLEHRNKVNFSNTKVEFNKTFQSMTLTPINHVQCYYISQKTRSKSYIYRYNVTKFRDILNKISKTLV